MYDFTNRAVLITGATGGLGTTVTRSFLEAGALVTGVSAHPSGSTQERLFEIAADVTTPEGARSAVQQTLAKWNRLDALIHLVGGFAGGRPVARTDDETWRRMMDLNLNAAFYMARAALPPMIEARRGRIIAVGSRTGAEPVATLGAYGASKAGLIALLRTIAAEVKNSGLTANVILPSVIDTPANRASDPGADHSKWVQPASVASLILWLASDAAADVNGAVIPIYGRV